MSGRHTLAYSVLIFSTVAITGLAIFAIIQDAEAAKDIFNIVLPVFSSWVGTILAFYFGRENFESANEQVRELVEKLAPEEREKASVGSIMRPIHQIVHIKLSNEISEDHLKLSDIRKRFVGSVSRLPIIDVHGMPKYIIHQARIDFYLVTYEKEDVTLRVFLDTLRLDGLSFGLDSGFVVVSEKTMIATAKQKMESILGCQDIFVTMQGNPNEPLMGWISNVRLMKYIRG